MINKSRHPFQLILLILLVIVAACTGNNNAANNSSSALKDIPVKTSEPVIGQETELLLKDLADNGNYVNSREFPSLIKASIVNDELDKNYLVIDIRDSEAYSSGHIKGAVNVSFESLPQYFSSTIKPFEFDRIIITCETGQTSSYTTSLLRLMGYGNVYAMRWGMSAWNTNFAWKGWLGGTSSDFQDQLETTINTRPAANSMPELNTGGQNGEEVANSRFETLFSEGRDIALISADKVFKSPEDYYIINYDRRDKHENGHIPGAIRYKPGATLSFISEMSTIPTDKPVVVYCGTGHNSGFVTAYLRLFGYDAKTLMYGNNGFMYNKMVEERSTLSWLPFTTAEVNNFETVK